MKQSAVIAALALTLLQPAFAVSWQTLQTQGQSLEIAGKNARAIACYEQALNLLPASAMNEKLCLESAIIQNLRTIDQFERSEIHFKQLMQYATALKAKNALDTNALFAIHALIDAGDNFQSKDYSAGKNHYRNSVSSAQSIALCQLAFPKLLSYERYNKLARTYIALADFKTAELRLTQALTFPDLKKGQHHSLTLELAAVQEHLGRPAAIKKETLQLMAQKNRASSLHKLGEAHVWAANYELGTAQLEQALTAAKAQSDVLEECETLQTLIWRYQDVLDYKSAEKYARKLLSAVPPNTSNPQFHELNSKAFWSLVDALRHQNKNSEADQLEKQLKVIETRARTQQKHLHPDQNSVERASSQTSQSNSDFFLSDKDRQELEAFKHKQSHK